MKRFVGLCVLVVLSAAVLYSGGRTEGKGTDTVLTVATVAVEKQYHPYSEACAKMQEYVAQKTNGKLTMRIYYGGSLTADEKEMLVMMRGGSLDMAIIAPSPMTTYEPIFAVLSLPYIFRDLDHAEKVMGGEVGSILQAKAEAKGFKILTWMIGKGFRSVNAIKAVYKPEDMAGLKVRVMQDPAYIDTFLAFGAKPVPIAWGELHTALQTKTIDAHENDPQVLDEYKFIEFTPFVSLTEHSLSPTPIVISKPKYDSLPANFQKVLGEAADIARVQGRKVANDVIDKAYGGIEKQGGKVNKVDKDAFLKAAKPIVDKYKTKFGEEGAKLVDLITK